RRDEDDARFGDGEDARDRDPQGDRREEPEHHGAVPDRGGHAVLLRRRRGDPDRARAELRGARDPQPSDPGVAPHFDPVLRLRTRRHRARRLRRRRRALARVPGRPSRPDRIAAVRVAAARCPGPLPLTVSLTRASGRSWSSGARLVLFSHLLAASLTRASGRSWSSGARVPSPHESQTGNVVALAVMVYSRRT